MTHHFTLGEPQLAGPLAVFPIFGPEPQLSYRVLAEALELGASVSELGGGVVGALMVENPTDLPLLIYEGEEVLGAAQNRTFDVSALVAEGARVQVPVSCTERGRWDSTRSRELFMAALHAANPDLRRAKRRAVDAQVLAGLPARANQSEVWNMVDARLAASGVSSPSSAMNDVFLSHSGELDAFTGAVRYCPGQLGAIAQAGNHLLVLDLVSRPDAFAQLLPRLARGYGLDALYCGVEARPDTASAERLLAAALGGDRVRLPAPEMGDAFRVSAPALVGGGVEQDGELVQLCAFPGGAAGDTARPSIARPSRRG